MAKPQLGKSADLLREKLFSTPSTATAPPVRKSASNISNASSGGSKSGISVKQSKSFDRLRTAPSVLRGDGEKLDRAKELFEASMKENAYYKAVMTIDGLGTSESTREGLLGLKSLVDEASRTDLTRPQIDPELRHLACYQIGLAYIRGVGARADVNEGLRWWLRAAEEVRYDSKSNVPFERQLNTVAGTKCQVSLALHYGQIQNWEKSYFWHQEAAQNGCIESLLQVGLMAWYNLGSTWSSNEERLHVVDGALSQAAAAGNISAMAHKGMFSLENGRLEDAFYWSNQVLENVGNLASSNVTLGSAISAIQKLPNNENSVEVLTESLTMTYFVLAQLYGHGSGGAEKDEKLAGNYLQTAQAIDSKFVETLGQVLEEHNEDRENKAAGDL